MKATLRVLVLVVACSAWSAASAAIARHALVVGVNGYGLDFADRDATEFADFIETPEGGGFPKGNVTLLINSQAGRSEIVQAIATISRDIERDAASSPGANTLVYIFIAGHSKADENTDEVYFMPNGADPSVPATGIKSDEFLNLVKGIRADRIIYFLDTCHAAASQNGGSASRDIPRNFQTALDSAWIERFKGSKERHMGLFSSSATQKSYEDSGLKHGIFTYYLLKGLRGEADLPPIGNGDGRVSSDEIKQYVAKYVPAQAKSLGSQTPTASLVWDGDWPMSTVPADIQLGIYSESFPESVLNEVRTALRQKEQIKEITLTADGLYAVISNAFVRSNVPALLSTVTEDVKTAGIGTPDHIAIGGESFIIIYGSNGYHSSGTQDNFNKQVISLHDQKSGIDSVSLDGSGNFLIIFDRNGTSSVGAPDGLIKKVTEIGQAGQTINNAGFGADGSWYVRYDGSRYEGLESNSLWTTLKTVIDSGKSIQAMAVQPATHAWLIVAP